MTERQNRGRETRRAVALNSTPSLYKKTHLAREKIFLKEEILYYYDKSADSEKFNQETQ